MTTIIRLMFAMELATKCEEYKVFSFLAKVKAKYHLHYKDKLGSKAALFRCQWDRLSAQTIVFQWSHDPHSINEIDLGAAIIQVNLFDLHHEFLR